MELILGLPPMSQYDAAATPMYNAFQTTPDAGAVHASRRRACRSTNERLERRPARAASLRMNFSDAGHGAGARAEPDHLAGRPRRAARSCRRRGEPASSGRLQATTTIDRGVRRAGFRVCEGVRGGIPSSPAIDLLIF